VCDLPRFGGALFGPQKSQNLAGQIIELQAAGCDRVYSEKVSGAHGDRVELVKVLRRLGAGDVLMVTRLDRLARSTRDLLNVLDTIKQAGAGSIPRAENVGDREFGERASARPIAWHAEQTCRANARPFCGSPISCTCT
jgi:DNA invertase Pin-like site-specific DNA recombinase